MALLTAFDHFNMRVIHSFRYAHVILPVQGVHILPVKRVDSIPLVVSMQCQIECQPAH